MFCYLKTSIVYNITTEKWEVRREGTVYVFDTRIAAMQKCVNAGWHYVIE